MTTRPRMSRRGATIEERIALHSEPGHNGCIVWIGSTDAKGYGRLNPYGQSRTCYAHRIAWEVAVGPIPDGMHIDHLCQNKGCINPEHLEVVTPGENNRRARAAAAERRRSA